VTLRKAVKATSSGGEGFSFDVIVQMVKINVKPTYVSVKCVTAVDATTVSAVRISRTMYVN